jgi:hypothetical protein
MKNSAIKCWQTCCILIVLIMQKKTSIHQWTRRRCKNIRIPYFYILVLLLSFVLFTFWHMMLWPSGYTVLKHQNQDFCSKACLKPQN